VDVPQSSVSISQSGRMLYDGRRRTSDKRTRCHMSETVSPDKPLVPKSPVTVPVQPEQPQPEPQPEEPESQPEPQPEEDGDNPEK
jgi:hypothetical protein